VQAKGWGVPNRNFWLGVYNGVLVNGGEAFFHSGLVLAPFLAALGAPGWVIGLIPALRVGGWFLPQLFVASRLAHQPFKLPLYRRTSTLRVVVLALLTATVFLVGDEPRVLIPVTLAVLALNSVAGGIGGVPFADVTAKVVPHYRLGTFWVLRNAIGGVLALLSGLVLRRVFDSDLVFPHDFGVVFLLGSVLVAGAYLSFALVREPPGVPALKEPLASMLRRLPEVLRVDVSFRRYLRVRFLGLLALMAEPFYAIYAITNLGAPVASLGDVRDRGDVRLDRGELRLPASGRPRSERGRAAGVGGVPGGGAAGGAADAHLARLRAGVRALGGRQLGHGHRRLEPAVRRLTGPAATAVRGGGEQHPGAAESGTGGRRRLGGSDRLPAAVRRGGDRGGREPGVLVPLQRAARARQGGA